MNWTAIGAIGELVGGVAVIGTLVYLAMQIRQNTKMNASAIRQSFYDYTTRLPQSGAHPLQSLLTFPGAAVIGLTSAGRLLCPDQRVRHHKTPPGGDGGMRKA